MDRTRVESSNLASVGYDNDNNILEVEFHHGGVYQYFEVPSSVYTGLMEADSKGKFFDQHVKKANYRYQKIG